jgi:hypothetical protein
VVWQAQAVLVALHMPPAPPVPVPVEPPLPPAPPVAPGLASLEQAAAKPSALARIRMPNRARLTRSPGRNGFGFALTCDKSPHPKHDSAVRELVFCMSITLPRVMDEGQKSG